MPFALECNRLVLSLNTLAGSKLRVVAELAAAVADVATVVAAAVVGLRLAIAIGYVNLVPAVLRSYQPVGPVAVRLVQALLDPASLSAPALVAALLQLFQCWPLKTEAKAELRSRLPGQE